VLSTALELAREDTGCEGATGAISHRGTAPLVRTFDVTVEGCGDTSLYQVNCGRRACDVERKGDLAEPPPQDPAQPPKLPEPIRMHQSPQ
jgi:hypothetical protein